MDGRNLFFVCNHIVYKIRRSDNMNGYVKTLIIMTVLCQIVLMLSSEILGDHTKRAIRFLCGAIMLITLFQPLNGIINSLSVFLDNYPEKVLDKNHINEDISQTQAVVQSLYSYIAESWMKYINDNYYVAPEQVRIILTTDENSDLISAEIILKNCPYTIRKSIEEDLNAESEIPIRIKGE